jgi:hypothetical protein
MNIKFLAMAAPLLLAACASTLDGSSQSVSITTNPSVGATCELTNDKGTWYIPATPGSVTLHRSAEDLTVICKKGPLHGTARVVSVTKGAAFGNILAGGLIGVAIDHSNGSAFDYPTLMDVPMSAHGSSIVIDLTPKRDDSAARKSEYPQ